MNPIVAFVLVCTTPNYTVVDRLHQNEGACFEQRALYQTSHPSVQHCHCVRMVDERLPCGLVPNTSDGQPLPFTVVSPDETRVPAGGFMTLPYGKVDPKGPHSVSPN